MGLRTSARRRLAWWAAYRPHVLVVTAPGGTAERLAVEAQVRALGGVLAAAPADTDLLATAGTPDAELAGAIDLLWGQVPAPKVRVDVPEPAEVAAALTSAIHELATTPQAGVEPAGEADSVSGSRHGHGDHDHQHDDHGHADHEGPELGGPEQGRGGHESGDDHSHTAHEGHGGHDHGGMQMPGGLMMADRGPDRDGLKLDVLRVALGPALPAWPSGLVMDVEMQGDLVQSAAPRVLSVPRGNSGFWTADPSKPRRRAAAHLDSIGRLLEVAGWSGAAEQVRQQRDAVLTDAGDGGENRAVRDLGRLRRRLQRSRGLRRSLAGLGRLDPDAVSRLGLTGPAARATGRGGDAWARLVTWLEETAQALDGRPVAPAEGPRGEPGRGSDALLAAAVALMPGLELADARLVLASLDPDTDELDASRTRGDGDLDHEGQHGSRHDRYSHHGQVGSGHEHEGQVHAG